MQIRRTGILRNISKLHAPRRQAGGRIKPIPTLKITRADEAVVEAYEGRIDAKKDELIERLRLIKDSVSTAHYRAIVIPYSIGKSDPGREIIAIGIC